jgi:hypothetical protein
MLLRKTHQISQLDGFTILADHTAGEISKHLMHFAKNEQQVGAGNAFLEGLKFQRQTALRISEFPGPVIVLGIILERNLLQLMKAAFQNQAVFGRCRGIPKPGAQV